MPQTFRDGWMLFWQIFRRGTSAGWFGLWLAGVVYFHACYLFAIALLTLFQS
jgi:hypothetical protein